MLKHTTVTQQGWKPASAQRTCWGFPIDLAIYTLTSTNTYRYQFNSDQSSQNMNSRASPPNFYWRRYINGNRGVPCPAPALTELLHSSDKFHHPSCKSTGPAKDTNPSTLQEQQGCSALVFWKCSNVAKRTSHSLSKTYPNAVTPPPLPHAAGYPGYALFFLLENIRQPSLRTKHSLWMCTRSGKQKPIQTQNDDKGKSINQTNYHQRGLGLQIRIKWFLQVLV